jgi:hypothetical protein
MGDCFPRRASRVTLASAVADGRTPNPRSNGPIRGTAFYCVADAANFLGAVGLLNSLRLLGHGEPFFLLDCGLTDEQRALFEPHARLVPAPLDSHPAMLKSVLPLSRPADVMVLLDADVLVVCDLRRLVETAASGRVVAFENDVDRYRHEWAERLDLEPMPRRPYVNSGHLLLPAQWGLPLLREFEHALSRLDLARTVVRGGPPRTESLDDVFFYTDQDVFNALLAARVPGQDVHLLEARLAPFPPFTGLHADPRTLRCEHPDGVRPYLLHHVLRKPWLSALPDSVYTQLLRRLLAGPDVALHVPRHLIPLRLRDGRLARADRARAHVHAVLRDNTRGRLGIRPRIQALLASRRTRRGQPTG